MIFYGDHKICFRQILVGSLVALVGPEADPVFFWRGAVFHGFGPLAKRHWILPKLRDVVCGAYGAFRYPDYHPFVADADVGVVGESFLPFRQRMG